MILKAYEDALRTARGYEAQTVDLLRRLVEMDRGSRNVSGLCAAAELLENVLQDLGCETRRHFDADYGPTLIGTIRGRGKARILIFAHMDTVWPEGTCAEWPFRVPGDGFAYGPGVSDNTAGAVAAICALRTMKSLGWDSFGELVFLFNPDEEISSPSSSKWILEYASRADLCLCMECASARDDYITRRAGGVYFEMRVKGVSSHAGVDPQSGRNAIAELANKLVEINQIEVPDAYGNISEISGGNGPCIVADNAYAMFRFRVDTREARQAVIARVEEIASKTFIEGTQTTLKLLQMGLPPLVKNEGTERYAALLEKIAMAAGRTMTEQFCGGGADSGTASQSGTPTLCGLGPFGEGYHTRAERFDLRELSPRVALLSVFLNEIGGAEQ